MATGMLGLISSGTPNSSASYQYDPQVTEAAKLRMPTCLGVSPGFERIRLSQANGL
jgi:DNA gyrase inhibitor GyrI